MKWDFVCRELQLLLDICDEKEAFLVSFNLMKDVPEAHMEKDCGLTDIYLEWDFEKHNWKVVKIC